MNDKLIIANELMKKDKSGLIYADLSYQVMGVLFRVYRRLGNSYQEKYYQRAVEIKATPTLKQGYLNQVLAYLNSANLKLGIVGNFRTNRMTYKRLVNPKVKI